MDRRNFLQGLFGGVTAAGLIVTAKPEEVAAFSGHLRREEPLVLKAPTPERVRVVDVGQHLYNEYGEVVAMVRQIDIHSPIDGLLSMEIRAVGLGDMVINRTSWMFGERFGRKS